MPAFLRVQPEARFRVRFLHHDSLPQSGIRAIYRNASWRGFFAVTAVMAAITAFTLMPKDGDTPEVAAGFAGAITLFFAALTVLRFRDCQHPKNWIAMDTEDGLFLNLRPAVNRHLPDEYPTVLHLPARHIDGVGQVIEHWDFPERHGREKHNVLYIEIRVNDASLEAVRDVLHLERRLDARHGGLLPHRVPDYPFVVRDEQTLHIAWQRIAPAESAALRHLQQHYPELPPRETAMANWDKADDDGKTAILARLWEQGHLDIAERLARLHKGITAKRARAWLDEFADQKADSRSAE